MVTRSRVWRRIDLQLRARRLSYAKARAIFNSLYREARALGILPARDPLEGLEVDIRLAKALNQLGAKGGRSNSGRKGEAAADGRRSASW